MDTKTLVHITTEVIVIGGVTFWLNNKISVVRTDVRELQERVKRLEEVVTQQSQVISRQSEILHQLMGEPSQQPQRRQVQPKSSGPIETKEEDLDELLGPELSDLLEERDTKSCKGDSCVIKTEKKRSNGK